MSTGVEVSEDGARLTVSIPMKIRKRGGRKVVVAPDGQSWSSPRPQVDSALVKAVARAYRWQRLLEEGGYASLRDLAKAEAISPTYISRLLRLTLLAPEIVEAVLDGRCDDANSQDWPSQPLAVVWGEQDLRLIT